MLMELRETTPVKSDVGEGGQSGEIFAQISLICRRSYFPADVFKVFGTPSS
jgi:hypothetical protein